jgi:hypothetical protein
MRANNILMVRLIFITIAIFVFDGNLFGQSTNLDSINRLQKPLELVETRKTAVVSKKVLKDTSKLGQNILDSVRLKREKDLFPVPRKAFVYGLLLPGAGQMYTEKYWYYKLPILYSGYALAGYFIAFNKNGYDNTRQGYYNLVNGLPTDPYLPPGRQYDPATVKAIRDNYYQQLQQSYIFLGVWHFLVAAEALTSAHLTHFDVSNDLSLRIKPSFDTSPIGGQSLGLGVVLCFK